MQVSIRLKLKLLNMRIIWYSLSSNLSPVFWINILPAVLFLLDVHNALFTSRLKVFQQHHCSHQFKLQWLTVQFFNSISTSLDHNPVFKRNTGGIINVKWGAQTSATHFQYNQKCWKLPFLTLLTKKIWITSKIVSLLPCATAKFPWKKVIKIHWEVIESSAKMWTAPFHKSFEKNPWSTLGFRSPPKSFQFFCMPWPTFS